MTDKRIIFCGTPDFAAVHLKALLDNNIIPVAVYTQPDRKKGRGHKTAPSPVKALALEHNIEVLTPENFKNEDDIKTFESFKADLAIVVAYGVLLPTRVIEAPLHGCVNVHGSLLPKLRGAAPIQRSILNGDKETGVCLMKIVKALDAGAVYVSKSIPIEDTDTSFTLFEKLSHLGSKTLLDNLDALLQGTLIPIEQDVAQVSYASKLTKDEAHLNFNESAIVIDRKVRGFNPWPIATVKLNDIYYKVFKTSITNIKSKAIAGSIYGCDKDGILVNTNDFLVRIEILQEPGKGRIKASDFARSHSDLIKVGANFE